jgi:hypothetical protein
MSAEKKSKAKEADDKVRKVSPRTFSTKQREAVMKKWYDLREKGMSAQDAATKVGVSYLSLHKWEKRFGGKPKADAPASAEVTNVIPLKEHKEKKAAKLEAATKASGILVTSPNGYTAVAPDIETAKQLMS